MRSTNRLSQRKPPAFDAAPLSRISRQTASHAAASNERADAADQSAAFPAGHSFESLQIESDARQRTAPDEPSLIAPLVLPRNPEDDLRERASRATNYDLSHAAIHRNSPLAAASGVEAFALSQEIHVAPGRYQPETPHGAHVLLHELAHVAQQGNDSARNAADPHEYDTLEQQAEAVAHRAAGLAPSASSTHLRALSPPTPTLFPQAFDPRYHRQATVHGLVGTGFSAEEIGQIYAANWERDFSQAHPALANIVLTWKAIKLAAFNRESLDPAIDRFNRAVGALLDMIPGRVSELANTQSYGGYNFYEHMDNPASEAALQGDRGEARVNREDLLVIPEGERIPKYMIDSREYIKAQLFRAAQSYRGDMHGQKTGQTAEAFRDRAAELEERMPGPPVARGALRTTAVAQETAIQVEHTPFQEITFEEEVITAPRGTGNGAGAEADLSTSGPAFNAEVDRRFWAQTNYKVNQRLDPSLPEDQPYIQIWLRIRNQVRAERQAALREREARTITMPAETIRGTVPRGPTGHWGPDVADAMGRAGHALEDFFAHSNFVELAIGQPAPTLLYNPATGKVEPVQGQLGTGAFGDNDKLHSLAHKIRAIADEIESEMPLVNRVAGRTTVDPTPDQVHVGSEAPPVAHSHDEHEHEGAPGFLDWVRAVGGTGLRAAGRIIGGGVLGGAAAGAVIGAALGGLLGGLAGGVIGGIAGFFASGGMEGLRTRIRETFRDVIATPQGIAMLRRIADVIERMTRANEEAGSHTALAKDQPGHDDSPSGRLRTIKFELAQELAAAADRMILGGMRAVFDVPSPKSANDLLNDIYTQLDALIAPPGNHPLDHLIEHRREEAIQALEEYQRHL
ncbi:eCIS core domain-containing protein [Roseiflexus sp. RS-1]|jgi:hypothetical protein|uniref:eCIS core domain-containing protein n=1 Tax=Roseiflexus sp. (strain RS-1) TaxID=357808 RepID=UPI0000D810CE|nr:DUF4157 domain-containing protein [Roseiflexus sp. RS-1]ABQ92150.1 hypothetical protein RoseRS_3796 [Roseiflexus sp. RS-1]